MTPISERLVYERALPAAADSVVKVRDELRKALERARVDTARHYDIALVMTEAAGNAVQHAYPARPPGLLFIDATVIDRDLLLRVCDSGRGMGPRVDAPGLGIGLSLMIRLADGLEISPNRSVGGTCVAAMFRDVASGRRPLTRRNGRRPDAVSRKEYLAALEANSAALREDADALMAEVERALADAEQLRADRSA